MNGQLIKRIAYNWPIYPLIKRLTEDADLWLENTWRQDYTVEGERPISPQKDTEAVMFRWAKENTIESVRDSLEIIDHENLEKIPEIKPIIGMCMNAADATELGRVFVAKLKSGGKVISHADFGMYSDHYERFHLVLKSDFGNRFFVSDTFGWCESCHMSPSEFYWFNHKENHWAINDSKSDRMHLIIDMVAKKYRRERVVFSA